MGTYFKFLCLLLQISFVLSCASQPSLSYPERAYKPDAIRLRLKADPNLNFIDGEPHTLHVCVYQLRDPNAFNQLANDRNGLYELLECNLFDSGVVGSKNLIVRSNQDLKITLDRAEGTKYVAIVAGYFLIEKERIVRLFEIPVLEKKKGFLGRTKYLELGDMEIGLRMGPKQIHSLSERDGDAPLSPMQLKQEAEDQVEETIQTPNRIEEQVKEVPQTLEQW